MNPLPVAHRELLVLSRRPWLYWLRLGTGLIIAVLSTGVVTVNLLNGAAPAEMGPPLFKTLTLLACLVSLLAGPVLLADSLAEEKRGGTLVLLFLTDLRSHDIIAGKFAALAMPAVHCLLAVLPVMAAAFFMGGVSVGEFARTSAALVNLLFFSLAATMLCSAVARDGRRAFAVAFGIVLLPALLLPLASGVLGQAGGLAALVLKLLSSPAGALWWAQDLEFSKGPKEFGHALFASQTANWLCLGAACVALPLTWQDRPDRLPRLTPRLQRRSASLALELSPLVWLARRQVGRPLTTWLLAGALALTILVVGPAFGLAGERVVLVAYALHALFKLPVAWSASRGFNRERNCGALEVLFVTPLGDTAVWRAWLAGLRRRFLLPALGLAAFDLALAWRGLLTESDRPVDAGAFTLVVLAVGMFLLDCYTLCWVGLWQGLSAPNATRACVRALLYVLVLPGAGFLALLGLLASSAAPLKEGLVPLALGWFVSGFLANVVVGTWSMLRLSDDCREAALRRGN
jgi:ABC-type transport system involved in multi-copper enzyme maturation permease subunit